MKVQCRKANLCYPTSLSQKDFRKADVYPASVYQGMLDSLIKNKGKRNKIF
jgi:hypothetical protein